MEKLVEKLCKKLCGKIVWNNYVDFFFYFVEKIGWKAPCSLAAIMTAAEGSITFHYTIPAPLQFTCVYPASEVKHVKAPSEIKWAHAASSFSRWTYLKAPKQLIPVVGGVCMTQPFGTARIFGRGTGAFCLPPLLRVERYIKKIC